MAENDGTVTRFGIEPETLDDYLAGWAEEYGDLDYFNPRSGDSEMDIYELVENAPITGPDGTSLSYVYSRSEDDAGSYMWEVWVGAVGLKLASLWEDQDHMTAEGRPPLMAARDIILEAVSQGNGLLERLDLVRFMPRPTVVDAHGAEYTPWSDGWAIGYRVERGDQVEFVYLNPTSQADDAISNVFVYQGAAGDPETDNPLVHVDLFPAES